MKTFATQATVALLVAAVGVHGSCLAAENGLAPLPESVPTALAGTAMSTAELGRQRARGIVIGSALSDGTVIGNSVSANSVTGIITNTNSINNNVGITTVFQNTGNNSLFQQSTSIFITVH